MSNISRRIMSLIAYPLVTFIRPKKGLVVITLHDVPCNHYLWFEQFIQCMLKHYEFIDPFQLNNEFSDSNSQPKVLLSFDDGFYSNRTIAEKFLSKYGIKGVFFITEDFIGERKSRKFMNETFYPNSPRQVFNRNESLPMSWSDVQWLVDHGHMIGAHTKSHPVLALINNPTRLITEVVSSADRMEDLVDTRINCFAFPFGTVASVNENTIALAKSRFDFVFSNVRGNVSESPSRGFMFRQNIVPGDYMSLTRAAIDGRLDWRYNHARKQSNKIFSVFQKR